MNENEQSGHSRSEGVWLVIVMCAVLAMLLAAGCTRIDKAFDEATAEKAPAYTDPAGEAFPLGSDDAGEETDLSRPSRMQAIRQGPRNHDRIRINAVGRLAEVFNDSNKYQYTAAERLGIRPIASIADAYFTSRPVSLIESNRYFTLDTLKHSLPFLVPEAERLLNDIGRNFIDSLASRGADGYRIRVTSLLRTPHTVQQLRRVNRNAVDSSTHQFGTTFDISFTRFHCLDSTRTIHEEDLKNLLAEVLLDLRNRDRCLVKYERKGGCFHITATGK